MEIPTMRIVVVMRCAKCSVLLEHPLEEFQHDFEGAIEEARKRQSRSIPMTCAKCASEMLHR